MKKLVTMKSQRLTVLLALSFLLLLSFNSGIHSQTLRNPVLEYCTGTWCPWCPCGKNVVINDILPSIPNAIILAYHGGSDPFVNFDGAGIRTALEFSAYPTGSADRVTGIINYHDGSWFNWMVQRSLIPATVSIQLDKRGYNPVTREYVAQFEFTALEDLSGEFNYNIILIENGVVYPQSTNGTCTPGMSYLPDYHHKWLVRDMMTGVYGEPLINGEWKKDVVITKTLNRILPPVSAPAPDIDRDSCKVVVLVNRNGRPLNSNAEIQQAEQWPMVSGDYKATISTAENEIFGSTTAPTALNAVVKNIGVLADTFHVNVTFNGPDGWSKTYTTMNGTFPLSHVDEFILQAGDSTEINIELNANGIPGVGYADLDFSTVNFSAGSTSWKFVTYGLEVLVVDDEENQHENFAVEALNLTGKNFGVVSSRLVSAAIEAINTFDIIFWMCAAAEPTLTLEEQNVIKTFLDKGGKLYLSGVDIAYELGDPTSPAYSDNSLNFLTNYLHATYVKRDYNVTILEKIEGDIITGGIGFFGLRGGTGGSTINPLNNDYPNQILPADTNAHAIFQYYPKTNDYPAIRANHFGTEGNGKIVFTTFGFESISKTPERNMFAQKIIDWMSLPTGLPDAASSTIPDHFELKQNYPNPFNPETYIGYILPEKNDVRLNIYNQLGQIVRTLINVKQEAGQYEVRWDGNNDQGLPVVSGVYFYRIQAGNFAAVKKLVLLR